MSINWRVSKQRVARPYDRIYLATERNEGLVCATARRNSRNTIVCERNQSVDHTLCEIHRKDVSIKAGEQNSQTEKTNFWLPKRRRRGINQELRINIYTPKEITNKDLPDSTVGSIQYKILYSQYFVIRERICKRNIYMYL